jgi:hypothetical protein
MKAVADTIGVARSHLYERVHRPSSPRNSYRKPDDDELLPLIRRLVDERPTYGYRRITALANRELASAAEPAVNHKRVFRRTACCSPGTRSQEPALVLGRFRDRLLER